MKHKLLLLLSVITFGLSAQTTMIDSIISGGIYRNYRIYVPAAYTGTSAWPLVYDLHGYTSSASAQQAYSNFMPIADTAHFLVVYPNGTLSGGYPYWNAGFGGAVDDVQFISDLTDSLSAQYNIDPNSVYSCGMSNGGYMSHTLACELNSKIAAIASVTGSMSSFQHASCNPTRPVPVMQISGTADATVYYNGSAGSLPIDTLVKYWVTENACNPTAAFNSVPNINTVDGCTAEHYVWSGGLSGSSVELYKIIGGGHTWPGSPFIIGTTNYDFSASEKIWLFFRKYKLNMLTGIDAISKTNELNIYPNPANDVLNVEGKGIVEFRIVDMNGKVVMIGKDSQLDISSLSKGVYSVLIFAENTRTVKKLVKM